LERLELSAERRNRGPDGRIPEHGAQPILGGYRRFQLGNLVGNDRHSCTLSAT
jgi:hypothetical protein